MMARKAIMTSTEFEQLTGRIISQVVESGAQLLWNDRIPDPDNPSQLRQVDVTISRDGRKRTSSAAITKRHKMLSG